MFQHNEHFIHNNDPSECFGHKWRLKSLWRHLREVEGLLDEDVGRIWSRIKDLVIVSILGGLTDMRKEFKKTCKSLYSCYKLLGEIKSYLANISSYS